MGWLCSPGVPLSLSLVSGWARWQLLLGLTGGRRFLGGGLQLPTQWSAIRRSDGV